jgi:Family of unknown function (DUF5677)
MTKVRLTIGIPKFQEQFINENTAFVLEYPLLIALLQKTFIRALGQPSIEEIEIVEQLPESDPKVTEFDNRVWADRVVFYLGRIAADDFSELLLLASNGYGFGSLKVLRGMYERIVTAAFIAKNPSEVRYFFNDSPIKRQGIWRRSLEWMPELKDRYTEEQIESLEQSYRKAMQNRAETICKSCNQPKTQHGWTRRDIETMAKDADPNLACLYASCYLEPTCHSHATSFGIERRLAGHNYRDSSEVEAKQALHLSHNLVLRLLWLQDAHFHLGLKPEIDARAEVFVRMYDREQSTKG